METTWRNRLPPPEELAARRTRQLIEQLSQGTLQSVNSEVWGLPEYAVVLVPQDVAQEYRELLLDHLVSGPTRTKGLWQAALHSVDRSDRPQKLRDLYQKFGVRLLHSDLFRFYTKVKELAPGGPRRSPETVSIVRRRMQQAHSEGEQAVWQSLLEDLTGPGNEKAPLIAQCRFCGNLFTPRERSNARTDVCQEPQCRRRADAERKRRAYHAGPRGP